MATVRLKGTMRMSSSVFQKGSVLRKKHDKFWWFGSNSAWCKLVSALGLKRWCAKKPVPPVPPPPPPVELEVCLESKMFPNPPYCKEVGMVSFVKGFEPREKCTLHRMPVCADNYNDAHRVFCISPANLVLISTKEKPDFKEADIPKMLDVMVSHGVRMLRTISAFFDEGDGWDSWQPSRDGSAYWECFHRRMKWITERNMTVILTVMPYKGDYSDNTIRQLVKEAKRYRPRVVFEPVNEPGGISEQKRVVDILKEDWYLVQREGAGAIWLQKEALLPTDTVLEHEPPVENKFIQLGWVDSGDFFNYFDATLHGEGLLCSHNTGSMETINCQEDGWNKRSPFPDGPPVGNVWKLMKMGYYPSDDGEDAHKAARGLMFYGDPRTRRPDNDQLYEMCKFLFKYTPGFDHMTAADFIHGNSPAIDDEVLAVLAAECDAMDRAYREVVG